MIEDVEDEDIQRMNTKLKLSSDSTHIMEDSDDEQIMFDRMEEKKPRKSEGLKKMI